MRSRTRSRLVKGASVLLSTFLTVGDIKWMLEYKLAKRRWFVFDGHQLEYFFHSYNNFRITERAIEIPIIKYYLSQENYQNVLEIGNVTNHYYDYFRQAFKKKTVVDKYEPGYNVVNLDICEYAPGIKFDFAFSVSTFEHMDSDRGMNPSYMKGRSKLISYAADNIRHVSTLLENKGKFIITAPLGYVAEWDETLLSGEFEKCDFAEHKIYVCKKVQELVWEQVELSEVKKAVYNYPLQGVNYLSIVEFNK